MDIPIQLVRNTGLRPQRPLRPLHVGLVCMPFSMPDRPSIQIGLLCSIARKAGFTADTYHLNLHLAALIPDCYEGLCTHRGRMTGEWLFSIAAFGEQASRDDQAYFDTFQDEVAWARKGGVTTDYLSRLRHEILPAFIEQCVTSAEWGAHDVIGFTSTFQQNAASIALARRIKALHPHVKIVFGGANMEDEMGLEYARAFPFIDYVVVGEGDESFPALLTSLAQGLDASDIPGVAANSPTGTSWRGHAAPVQDLDALPSPDYSEYFERVRRVSLKHQSQWLFAVPFESSRGCWWGQKHHCTFCGLNGTGMRFRAKRPERVLDELSGFFQQHGVTMFQATDNILDMDYLKQFFARIEETRTDYQFFYEVKANLTREQLRGMRRGGVRWLQPGIESLSTEVLKLMRKGCTMLQNVRLLKWANYYRMRVGWNLLWGFPGEREEYYEGEFKALRLLTHLEPPNACGRIWMERFSPIFFDRKQFPARHVQPEPSYAFVYPSHVDLNKVAYFFDCELENTLPDSVHERTVALVREWKENWPSTQPHTLYYRRSLDALVVEDCRGPEFFGTHAFHGPAATAYEYCGETMRTPADVARHLQAAGGHGYGGDEVRGVLDQFCSRGLMLEEAGRYLSLALPINLNW